uniref:Uncharacterized protein n=1 Tax=Brassica oleracea var. oleracea TaxID=109376 RepID=A0A0D3AMN4_BRAOL
MAVVGYLSFGVSLDSSLVSLSLDGCRRLPLFRCLSRLFFGFSLSTATSLSIGGSLVSLSLGGSSLNGDRTPSWCLSSKILYLGWSQARRQGTDNYLDGSPPIESWFAMRMMKGINQVQGLQQALQDISSQSSSQLPSVGCANVGEKRERKTWTPTDDILLISSWLNTSKDPIVSNEQKSSNFWKRVAAYFAASPKAAGSEEKTDNNFATRERSSGCNENDVLKRAHEIFFNNHKKIFTLERAWKELRNDQKWCEVSSAKKVGTSRKRKCEDGADSSACQPSENKRPAGVKASKAAGKKTMSEENSVNRFQSMWDIKQKELEVKERLSKMSILDSLIAKKEPLADYEEALKKKFISEDKVKTMSRSGAIRVSAFVVFGVLCHVVSVSRQYHRVEQSESINALGRASLSPLQKCTTAICLLAYGNAADAVDEYLRLGSTTTRSCLEHFVDEIISLFGEEYLRRPTPADLQRLLDIGEYRGFPGMIGSIDCMNWEWKNCPTAWKGQYTWGSGKPTIVLEAVASYDLWIWHAFFGPPCTLNDINVLDRSPAFDGIINGEAPQVTYYVNGREYHLTYYFTDGPQAVLFAQRQEAVRKDVERDFGVLQARFTIIKNPTLFWDKVKIGKIMRACIILHNMIVEDERDGYTQFDVSDFQEAEDNGSSHVDLTYSTNMPSNIANMMSARNRIRDRQMHQQRKADLVEHI